MTVKKGLRVGAAAAALTMGMQLFGSLALGPGAEALQGTVRATTRVHVRAKPTTASASLTILDRGANVVATGTTGSWTKVRWRGRTAYVYSKYLTSNTSGTAAKVTQTRRGTMRTTANLNVRTGPSLNNRVVGVAPRGTAMSLTGRSSGDYTQVTWRGTQRWVAARYLSAGTTGGAVPKVATVQTTANLNVRVGSALGHRSVAIASKGTVMPTTGRVANGFTQVVWRNTPRWVASRYLRPVSSTTPPLSNDSNLPATTKRWATADLNVWYDSRSQRHSEEIAKGSEIAVTSKVANGRIQIVHKGALRWVTARYTTSSRPGGAAPGTWDLTSPPITGGPRGKALNKGYSSGMHRTNPYIQRISADAWARFPQIKTHYGWRRDVTPDHPAGRAVDLMIPNYRSNKDLGWAVARYYQRYAKQLNIKYIIWDQKIWSVARSKEGWRPMANRGGDTANHLDHVHVNSN